MKKPTNSAVLVMVEPSGIEPLTSTLPVNQYPMDHRQNRRFPTHFGPGQPLLRLKFRPVSVPNPTPEPAR